MTSPGTPAAADAPGRPPPTTEGVARVLLVTDYATVSGGAERVVLELRDEFRARGLEARLLASSARPLDLPVEADVTCFGTTGRTRTLVQSWNPSAAAALRRELVRFQPDVVHVRLFLTQLSPTILRHLRGVPAVLHVADYRTICPRSSKQLPDGSACREPQGRACRRNGCLPLRDALPLSFQRRLHARWSSVFDAVVANSDWVRARLEEDGERVSDVVWNGVPVTRPAEPVAGVISFAGRLVPEKGVEVLLRAFALVRTQAPAARLVVAGDGPGRADAERLAVALGVGDAVTFAGHLPPTDLERALASAAVHVVPSTWEEPFGRAAAEALMRGQAVVASNTGGLSELVSAAGGRLVPAGDRDRLASALVELLQQPQLAHRIGAAGRRFALAELTTQRFAGRFLDVYERLAQPPSKTGAVG